ncbi:putative anion transporter 2, chloroplastic [Symbiodinium microadriaticum]|nr:putative anion transporter 2, chloroplastic [Symbiodinium microadriaticum]
MAPSFLEACPGTPVPRTTRHCGQRSVPAAGGGAAGFGQLHACLLEHKALSTSSHLMPAVLAGCFGALRRRRRTACRSFHWPWSLSKEADETAKHWWHHHPRASDILIGWIQHSQLTQGNRIDLEVEFSTSSRGRWRSRGLGFKGPFEARVDRTGDAAYLILADSSTVLRGRMEEASLSIQGIVTHENVAGGSFVLQALPDCYHEWWSHIKGELANYHGNNPGILVFSEDGQIEGPADESSSEDSTDVPDITSPADLRKFLLKRLTQVKEYLASWMTLAKNTLKTDRYVICQTAAKEMLSVAICDHYNRAKEELAVDVEPNRTEPKAEVLLGVMHFPFMWDYEKLEKDQPEEKPAAASKASEGVAEEAVQEKAKQADPPGEISEQSPADAETGAKVDSSNDGLDKVQFTDTDGDVILLQVEEDQVAEYVNGEPELEHVERFEIDLEKRTYRDDSGEGHFDESEDLPKLQAEVKALFTRAAKSTLSKPKRVKNYTKPNILLLGPTGSGKTYLLRNLAAARLDLIGVPFVKADATKFTETGYVGRDADEVMSELLQAADGDVELAQVGIVYVDEIDKVCSEGGGRTSSFRRATQSTFLKLMEDDTEVTVGGQGPRLVLGAMGGDKGTKMSTRHVLFVFSGAFSQLDEKLKEAAPFNWGFFSQDHIRDMKGFGFTSGAAEKAEDVRSMLHKADTEAWMNAACYLVGAGKFEELVKAGMEREFVGRLPVRVALQALSDEDLFQATSQLTDDFRRYGIEFRAWSRDGLRFTDAALRTVAQKAAKEGTGEGTSSACRPLFPVDAKFWRLSNANVDPDLIENPEQRLEKLLSQYALNDATRIAQCCATYDASAQPEMCKVEQPDADLCADLYGAEALTCVCEADASTCVDKKCAGCSGEQCQLCHQEAAAVHQCCQDHRHFTTAPKSPKMCEDAFVETCMDERCHGCGREPCELCHQDAFHIQGCCGKCEASGAALLGRCLVAWSLQPDEEASLAFVGVHPQHRHVRVWLRAEDADEVAALLAQAEALRREAAQDEEEVKAARVQREASEAAEVKKAEDAFGSEIQVEVRPGEDPILAKARAELAAARANLAAAKLEAEAVAAGRQVTGQQDQPGSQPSVPPPVPVGKLEDVKLNLSGTLMTEDEWNDLAEKFEDMNLIEQFQTNSKLGSQVVKCLSMSKIIKLVCMCLGESTWATVNAMTVDKSILVADAIRLALVPMTNTSKHVLRGLASGLADKSMKSPPSYCKVTSLYAHWTHLVPRVRMQVLMAGVCVSNYLLRACLGTCAVLMVQEYHWDVQVKGMLLGSFFWGYLAGNMCAGPVSSRYGAGLVLAFAAISWSSLAIAIPMASDLGFWHVWLLHILLGLAASPVMPTTMQLISAYVPASERGCSLAARALAFRFGQIVASVLAPLICSQAGWRASFCIFGTVSFLFSMLWLGFAMTKKDSRIEVRKTCQGDDSSEEPVQGVKSDHCFLPLHALRKRGFLALLVVHCSNNFAMYTIMSWGPSYFTEVLQLPLESVGLYLMLPAAFSGVGSVIGGLITDWLQSRRWPPLAMRRWILCPAALGAGVSLVIFGIMRDAMTASLAITLAALSIGVLDTAQNTVYLDVAPTNAAALVSLGNAIATLPGAAGPALVAALLQATGLWPLVWGIIAACLVVSAIVFAAFGSVDDLEKKLSPKYMQV